jgi:3-phosphoshikimate 1-carboxyvinyltransferase
VQGLEVERDWSAAAMMLVAGAVAGEVTLRHLDPFSTQSDAVIIDLLKHSHVDMDLSKDNRTITVRRSLLQPFFFDITDAPDLFAPLFVLATFAEGESVIVGTERLKNKESNRAASFVEEFRKLGVQTAVSNDQMIIYGHHNHRLFGASCSAHGDHRLAMALMIASLFAEGPVQIDDPSCVAKSFPEFLDQFQKIKR